MNNKKWHICPNCGKTLSSYKCLWRHKKNCKFGGEFNNNKNNITSAKQDLNELINACDESSESKTDKNDDKRSSTDSGNGESSSHHELSNEEVSSSDESSGEMNDLVVAENLAFWEYAVRRWTEDHVCRNLVEEILLYKIKETDELLQDIIYDADNAMSKGCPLIDAVHFATEKYKDLIMQSITSECPDKDVDEVIHLNFWCALTNRFVQPGCKYYDGEDCSCDECKGTGIISTIKPLIVGLILAENDDLIQKLIHKINEKFDQDNEMEWNDASKFVIRQHKTEILMKYNKAKGILHEFGWNESMRKRRSGTKRSEYCHDIDFHTLRQ